MAGRVVLEPRGESEMGAVSALCEGRAAEREVGLRLGPRASGREGGLGAERGSFCGGLLFDNSGGGGLRSPAEAERMVCA